MTVFTLKSWFAGEFIRIERAEFANGVVWDAVQLRAFASATPVNGTYGDNYLTGDSRSNTFIGGKGNDHLVGAEGDDIYIFEQGDGRDIIEEAGANEGVDTIRFGVGIAVSDIVVSRSKGDIVLTVAGTDDSITIADWTNSSSFGIERVEFADGTVWNESILASKIGVQPFVGTRLNDTLNGNGEDNIFIGGEGNDDLNGSQGSDTYVFERGDGKDRIYDYSYASGEVDTLRFGASIAASDIVISRAGASVVFTIVGTDDSVTVSDWVSGSYYHLERVEFFDGTAWNYAALTAKVALLPIIGTAGNDALNGNSGPNSFNGMAGDDEIDGGQGADTYLFSRGDGSDRISEFGYEPGEIDAIRFGRGIDASDIVISRSGKDIVFSIEGTNDSITMTNWTAADYYRIERIDFADGTTWDQAALTAKVAALPFIGTAGNDALNGNSGPNIFNGLAGDDDIDGGQGADTYLFSRGDGNDRISEFGYEPGEIDAIRFGRGIDASDIVISRSGKDIVCSIEGTNDSITMTNWTAADYYRIERIDFADGTTWDQAALTAKVAALPFIGTAGNDALNGNSGPNIFNGLAGDDDIDGGQGADTYLFSRGDGNDRISEFGYEPGEIDAIRFGRGIDASDIVISRSGKDIVFSIEGTNDSITMTNWTAADYYRIERIDFADGTTWDQAALTAKVAALPFIGTAGNDALNGNSGPNIFNGMAGDDDIDGGQGADTYLFSRGDGNDRISEFGYEPGEIDAIRFGRGIDAGDIVISRSGKDIVFSIEGTNDSITMTNWTAADYYRIERIDFADGTTWDQAALTAKVAALPLIGTPGNDSLIGDSGPNIFDGLAGDDKMDGGEGADVYLIARGDGNDRISEFGDKAGETDTIRFGEGIGADDIVVSQSGSDIVFAVDGTRDSITIANWKSAGYCRIERIDFFDGTSWDSGKIEEVTLIGIAGA